MAATKIIDKSRNEKFKKYGEIHVYNFNDKYTTLSPKQKEIME